MNNDTKLTIRDYAHKSTMQKENYMSVGGGGGGGIQSGRVGRMHGHKTPKI